VSGNKAVASELSERARTKGIAFGVNPVRSRVRTGPSEAASCLVERVERAERVGMPLVVCIRKADIFGLGEVAQARIPGNCLSLVLLPITLNR
jgi:hypothetical protein